MVLKLGLLSMNNYKLLHFPNFEDIRESLLNIVQPYIGKNYANKDTNYYSFMSDNLQKFYDIDILWDDFASFGVNKDDLIYVALIVAGGTFMPHTDSTVPIENSKAPLRGLNFPLKNCVGTSLVFYEDVGSHKTLEYDPYDKSYYYQYDPAYLKEVDRVSYVDNPVIFNAYKIHSISGASDDACRVVASFRFKDHITFGLE
jgi:hypothetical protein